MTAQVTNLNHAVLYVSDVARSQNFYQEAFGFEVVDSMGDQAVFLKAAGGGNHHDLALMTVGANARRPPRGSVGLYHLAWEVPSIEDLVAMAQKLTELGALGGMSDHGVSKSLYAHDPDGIEFEVMYRVPREAWGDYEKKAVVKPLDLAAALARFGKPTASTG
jgi:catechol-2,3-dioxygenase